tara:strand:- start:887 stop:1009 length:123 start_codon:yes stop_codon:yes gene_type:complete
MKQHEESQLSLQFLAFLKAEMTHRSVDDNVVKHGPKIIEG